MFNSMITFGDLAKIAGVAYVLGFISFPVLVMLIGYFSRKK